MSDCVFCRIVEGAAPSHAIAADDEHIAILDIHPSVRGQSLVLPRRHVPGHVFDLAPEDYSRLMEATRRVAVDACKSLGALRMCMVMEGMEVDHAHIKLYPIYHVVTNTCDELEDLNSYRGYISTKHGERMPDDELARIAALFRA